MPYRTIYYRGKQKIYSYGGSQQIVAQRSSKGRLKASYSFGKMPRQGDGKWTVF